MGIELKKSISGSSNASSNGEPIIEKKVIKNVETQGETKNSGIINAPKVSPPGYKLDDKGVPRRVFR
ncbi:unnamed protein product [Diamesa serratosioi]